MLVYRIASEPFASDLSGEGARLFGGRWNPCGIPVLYTSESIALATLEVLVNVPSDYLCLDMFSRITIHVPDDVTIHTMETTTLPAEWCTYPAPPVLAELGRKWFQERTALVLKVPAVVVNGEDWNYLINPYHPDHHRILIDHITRFCFDTRLLRR
jgi:RES domain-containing protein